MAGNTFCNIDKELLPFKLHYLILYAGCGAVIPFLALFGKGLGISATAVGICNTTHKILVLVSKPFLGSLVDYFRNIRLFLLCLLLTKVVSSLCLLLLPPISEKTPEPVDMMLSLSNKSEELIKIPFSYHKKCIETLIETAELKCTGVFQFQNNSRHNSSHLIVSHVQLEAIRYEDLQMQNVTPKRYHSDLDIRYAIKLHPKDLEDANLTKMANISTSKLECDPDVQPCSFQDRESSALVFESYQFWVFAFLVVSAGLGGGNLFTLSDVACYEVLGDRRQLYGRQRLYGTIGWAFACLLSGYLNDLATGSKGRIDYSPGFYLMACLLLMDAFILCKVPMTKVKLSNNIWKDVRKTFHSAEIIVFAVAVVGIGCMTATVSQLEFWYLQDLGASQTLLGTTIIVQCLVAEAPFFVISGWIVKKLGCLNCLVGSFLAFAVRLGLYTVITNPWWVLVIDLTNAFTFAMFHASMTTFASLNAPDGIEGSMFGIFAGLTDGLGQTTGSLLSGASYDKFGGRFTFTLASVFSLVCAILFAILPHVIQKCSKDKRNENAYVQTPTNIQ